jgi:hypothetical protein
MKKHETLEHWRGLSDNQPMLRHMQAIPYKAKGSTYGACGVRIDGNPAFVDAVMSHLKELLNGENHVTRLGLARNVVDGSGLGKQLDNKDDGAEVCYIRLHVRGNEGMIASGMFDRHLDKATEVWESGAIAQAGEVEA